MIFFSKKKLTIVFLLRRYFDYLKDVIHLYGQVHSFYRNIKFLNQMPYEKNKTNEHPFLKWVWADGAPERLVSESLLAPF